MCRRCWAFIVNLSLSHSRRRPPGGVFSRSGRAGWRRRESSGCRPLPATQPVHSPAIASSPTTTTTRREREPSHHAGPPGWAGEGAGAARGEARHPRPPLQRPLRPHPHGQAEAQDAGCEEEHQSGVERRAHPLHRRSRASCQTGRVRQGHLLRRPDGQRGAGHRPAGGGGEDEGAAAGRRRRDRRQEAGAQPAELPRGGERHLPVRGDGEAGRGDQAEERRVRGDRAPAAVDRHP